MARTAALVEGSKTTISKEWVEDLRAAFHFIRERYPGRVISYVGHSVGGKHVSSSLRCECSFAFLAAHIAPLVQSNDDRIIRNLFLGSTLQYHGYYPHPDRRQQQFQKIESMVKQIGYFPSSRLGLGADVPAGVGLETVS